jgi:predicted naringenin-chalcone synthase
MVETVELCTLAFRLDKPTKANIVATALFGDGGAACVLRAGEAGLPWSRREASTPGRIRSTSWAGMSNRKTSV